MIPYKEYDIKGGGNMFYELIKEIKEEMMIKEEIKWYEKAMAILYCIIALGCLVSACLGYKIAVIVFLLLAIIICMVATVYLNRKKYNYSKRTDQVYSFLEKRGYLNERTLSWIMENINKEIENIKERYDRFSEMAKWIMSIIIWPTVISFFVMVFDKIDNILNIEVLSVVFVLWLALFMGFMAIVYIIYSSRQTQVSNYEEILITISYILNIKMEEKEISIEEPL